ncbi:MAG: M16 family metallopeptidase [bacterium]
MQRTQKIAFLVLLLVWSFQMTTGFLQAQVVDSKPIGLDWNQKLPVDPKITVGKFDNGLTYYIRVNKKPAKRAELRLVVNAGSVLEEDDQQGIAHFVEHMAFNGTKHFAKQEIVDYLESVGMRFGPDINASTSFDETVYMLQVPTDKAEILETAFQILEDWAHNVSFNEAEVDNERGVVIEEWRLGRGAAARMRDKQFPILFHDSRYARRLPIGKREILDSAHSETLRRFYRDWYRPDLMAVIAVGDFDKSRMEDLIIQHFSPLPLAKNARERKLYPVPDHQETLFAIASDPEATRSSVTLYFKHDVEEQETAAAYRKLLMGLLYNGMFNNRLNELVKQADPPFLFGFSSKGRFIRSKEFYLLGAAVKDNGIERGLEALLAEAKRVKLYGFTDSELERQKADMLRGIELAYNERDKSNSDQYAAEFIRNFLTDEPIPGIEYEFKLYQTLMPTIHVQEVNELAGNWISDANRVILVNGPEKEGVEIPNQEALLAVFEEAKSKSVAPYSDTVSDLPLVGNLPRPGHITRKHKIKKLGVTEWTLSNGVRVILKPTDFKNDQIIFTAFSPGGSSLVDDKHYVAAITATSLVEEGGLGDFDEIALQKKLAGKAVRVSPWIGSLQEGLSGSASPADLETLLELIYLYFTAPRQDSTAFASYQARIKGLLENRQASPQAAFRDTLQVILTQHNFRTRPWSEAMLREMDLQESLQIYRNRFADASDFTFIFVGNIDFHKFKPLVQSYLGALPATGRKETWRDVGIRYPRGVIKRAVKRGLEPKSQVRLVFSGPFQWNRQNRYQLNAMTSVLQIKLREVLREDKGGTYGVGVSASASHYPVEDYSISISFGCAPKRVAELTRLVFEQIDSLKTFGIADSYVAKVKEMQRRQREVNLKENGFWLSILRTYYFHQQNLPDILKYDKLVKHLSAKSIQKAARQYFDLDNYVQVVLYPEQFDDTGNDSAGAKGE